MTSASPTTVVPVGMQLITQALERVRHITSVNTRSACDKAVKDETKDGVPYIEQVDSDRRA